MTDTEKKSIQNNEDFSLPELIQDIKKYWSFLLSKWLIILIFGLSGGVLGLLASFILKPKYTAHMSFALLESSGGGLADLASTFGFSGFGGSNNGAFSGDNLLEIIKSHNALEKTMLTPVNYNGKIMNLIEVYIEFNDLRVRWNKNKKKLELHNLYFPVGQQRETFSRVQDSVVSAITEGFIKSNIINVAKKNKKISIVDIDFTSKDEYFSKKFLETLMDQTYLFYKQTKTAQSKANIVMMQHTADSIKVLYERALIKRAGISQVNINQALQLAEVPRIKQENDAQLYGTVYAEVLKNLETLKLDMARETPLVQIIDTSRYPLYKQKLGKIKGIALGGILGGIFIVGYLLGMLYIKEKLNTTQLG